MKKTVMNKWIKSIALVFLLILILSMFSVVQSDGDNFDTGAFDNYDGDTKVNELVDNTAETAVAVLRVASVAIAIVVLLVIAMKYMISSSGDRADIKKHAVAYVVGTFILFSVTQIIALLIDISNKTLNSTESA